MFDEAKYIESQLNEETTVFLLTNGYYTATFGRFTTEEEAKVYRESLTQFVLNPTIMNIGEECPIRIEDQNYIRCKARINDPISLLRMNEKVLK